MIATQAAAILAVIGVVYVTGWNIPLPGSDAQILSAVYRSGGEAALRRVSIFALGVMPLYSALAIGEFGRLIFTNTKKSAEQDSRTAFLKTKAVLGGVALIAIAAFLGLRNQPA